MIIESITITNFRCHQDYFLKCQKDTTLILGQNGCGKTSVLEAIYILTRGKSFRATDSEIIKRGSKFYRIEIKLDNGEKNIASYDGNVKTFLISDKKTRRLPKKNKYPVVLFLPSDLNLISHSPSRRRDYFDNFFSILSEEYNNDLLKYEKALKQRNELLKSDYLKKDQLFSWDLMLAKYGTKLFTIRKDFINNINSLLTDTYYSIAKTKDQINLIYKTDVVSKNESQYLKHLDENFSKDQILKHTSFGVHRDDYIFEFNQKLADGSASRGETRSIILALKFIEAELIEKELNLKPIILLD
ncbi:DNA replication and repair protein RecF, partial [Candidatus Saccharibacteria bacterium]|nr:DNA replication and repair protein RecF [Candidatus Saccharibacteria bacterium]